MLPSPSALFAKAIAAGASDVHLAAETPVVIRVQGTLQPLEEGICKAADIEKFVKQVLDEQSWKRFTQDREIDAAYTLESGARLRVNCHYERGNVSLVARVIPDVIPSVESLGLEAIAQHILALGEGLVLFTGPTGAGKSTSLASLLQAIGAKRPTNMITLEDPVEFLLPRGQGIVRQRQLGQDFHSYAEALKHILRQDPDVVMVGEMRDAETIAAALTLAETGHLIFATLHTPNTVQTIDRIIDVFPPFQQPQIRSQLSLSLRMVVAQRLLPRKGGGQVAQREVLVMTPAVGNTIRENRLQELHSVLQTGGDAGMVTFEADAKRLLEEGVITEETVEWVARL